jgi:23S rRNA pseudouridine1911/1915/1917 synthase
MELSFGALSPPKPCEHFKGPSTSQCLDAFLEEKSFRPLIEFGAVYVNRARVIDPQFIVGAEDVIRIHVNPKRYILDKEKIRSRIVFENDNFIVVDKPSGLPMHPTLDNLYENLLYAFEVPVYVTHRLDVPTSGLVVVAKTKKYQSLFNKLISERKLRKIYEAIVTKALEPQVLTHYMKSTLTAPKVFGFKPGDDESTWFECRLAIRSCVENLDGTFKLNIELLTGRTHQIRGQLALVGAPILGDEMYGGPANGTFGLRAISLEFICPEEANLMSFKLTT